MRSDQYIEVGQLAVALVVLVGAVVQILLQRELNPTLAAVTLVVIGFYFGKTVGTTVSSKS